MAAFRKYVDRTGCPETFELISTAQPPRGGEIVALHHPIDINPKQRPDGGKAPCPICSPSTGKYLAGGTLIWCSETKAIYAIGPDCSTSIWSDNRLARAVNLLRRTERDQANAATLKREAALAPARLEWIEQHRPLAQQVDALHASLAKDAPGLRQSISHAVKGQTFSHISGTEFLTGSWRIAQNLAEVARVLDKMADRLDSSSWVDELSAKGLEEQLELARKAMQVLSRQEQRIAEARKFLSVRNAKALVGWNTYWWAPRDFQASASIDASQVILEARHRWTEHVERWQGPLDLPAPKPIPGS